MSDSTPPLSAVTEREVPSRSRAGNSLDLDKLFNPDSVAIIGASRDLGKSGGDFVKRVKERGYQGALYPINRRETEIMGLKTYPSILDVQGKVDLAVFCIPAAGVIEAMKECNKKGVKFAVVHTAGFREVGNPGLEAELLRVAREGGTRFVGPNCMGVFSNKPRLSLLGSAPEPDVTGEDVAFIAQSGTLCDNLIWQGQDRGLKVNYAISLGNESDLRFTDYLAYMADDPEIKMIGAYIEGIQDGRKFLDMVQKVNRRKPVAVWKAGRTAAGTRATLSHTGSIAGSHSINEAAFRQAGLMRASGIEGAIDQLAGLYTPFWPQGRRVGILVDTGGGAVSAADAFEIVGLEVTPLSQEVRQALRKGLESYIPPFAGISNPVDLVSPKDEDRIRLYDYCLDLMAPEVDSIVTITFQDLTDLNFLSALEQARDRLKKPIFMVPAMPQKFSEMIKVYTRRGIPAYHHVDRAARAIKGVVDYVRWRAG
ncbi:MAG: CoA-binding protein [Chloroflexi bacterium]|nr:CoA-binding protein [Chloroflexota bacterium]